MRYDDIKKRKQDDDVEDELVKRLKHLTTEDNEMLTKLDVVTDDRAALDKVMEEERASRDQKHLTTEDTSAFVAGFGNLNAQQLQALDRLGAAAPRLRSRARCSTTNAEPVHPAMNENFGFDEQPTPDAVVSDMKKEAEKVRNRDAQIHHWLRYRTTPRALTTRRYSMGCTATGATKEAKLKAES